MERPPLRLRPWVRHDDAIGEGGDERERGPRRPAGYSQVDFRGVHRGDKLGRFGWRRHADRSYLYAVDAQELCTAGLDV